MCRRCGGVFKNLEDAVEHMVHVGKVYKPRSEYKEIYAEKFARYEAALAASGFACGKIAVEEKVMFTISPSLYSADLLDLREVIGKLKGFEHLHLDIDDGKFVRGISFGMEVVKGVAECTEIPLDAHLEVLNPMEYVEPLCEAGVEMICAHVESLDFPSLFLGSVHQYGKKAGLALNVKNSD